MIAYLYIVNLDRD